MSVRMIENEEQYQKTVFWLLEKAKELDHPLLDEQKKQELMQKFDAWCEEVRRYNINWFSDRDPDIRVRYEELGVLQKQADPEPQRQGENINLSDWLDE